MYYYPKNEDIDSKIKKIGLCEAIITFTQWEFINKCNLFKCFKVNHWIIINHLFFCRILLPYLPMKYVLFTLKLFLHFILINHIVQFLKIYAFCSQDFYRQIMWNPSHTENQTSLFATRKRLLVYYGKLPRKPVIYFSAI